MASSIVPSFYFLGNFATLKPGTACDILSKALNNDLPDVQPTRLLTRPEPMQAFVYVCTTENDDLFKADGYWWRDGSFKKNEKCGVKTHYYYITQAPESSSTSAQTGQSSAFRKIVFSLIEKGCQIIVPVLVWYSGNKDVVQRIPHGNSKIDRPYLPTLSSFKSKIQTEISSNYSNKEALITLKKTALEVERKLN